MKKRNNILLYIIFVVVIAVIITTFILFFSYFSKIDKHVYEVSLGSVAFDDNFNYIKIEETSKMKQRIDGNYYIYEEKDGKQYKYKIGERAIIYNSSDGYVKLYGNAYQVMSNGDVINVEGEVKIPKTGATKFYKLSDRKYLIVANDINSLNDNVIRAKDYLIIELDKQGNAIFANNEINFKAVKPITLATSDLVFDIANEKLIIGEDEIDLKNIIGSTNEYKEDPVEIVETDTKEDDEEENYYDKYLTEVVRSVNNLANGVGQLNDKSETVTVDTGQKYYEITKWIALRGVSKDVTSITLDYYVFDPADEYQAVFFEIVDTNQISIRHYVNKDSTSFTIRDLLPNSEYYISLGYQIASYTEPYYVDEIKVKTDKPNYSIKVDKIVVKNSEDNIDEKVYDVYFSLDIDKMYIFNKAKIHFYTDNILRDERITLCTTRSQNCDVIMNTDSTYHGMIELTSLGIENKIAIDDIEVCNSEGTCAISELVAFYKFYSE